MLRCKGLIVAVVGVVLASSPCARAQTASELLEKGIFAEETVGDLDAAIKIYVQITASAEKNRPFAAQAQYRLGMCYLKKGQKQEAANAFRKLIAQFPMQTDLIAQAKVQLSALGHPITGVVTRQVWADAPDAEGGVSPDGRFLSYVRWITGDLALHDLTTGENRDLTNKGSWSASNEFAQESRISPDGKQVAYAWFNDKFYDLRIVGLDGSEPRVLSANEEVFYIEPAAWSPDGKYILARFDSRNNRTTQIVLVSVATGSVRVLKTLDRRRSLNMAFSPDGRYVAYDFPAEEGSPERDIYVLASDGSGEVPLVEHPASDSVLGWTPDGTRILFASDRTDRISAWLIRVDNGKPQGSPELIKKDMGRINPIGFTPNGSFYYSVESGIPDVYTATLDVGTGKFLAAPTKVAQRYVGTNFAPDWSPDGKQLVYLSQRGRMPGHVGFHELVIRTLESGQERILSPELAFHRTALPRWSPDGRSILVNGRDVNSPRRGRCYVIDAQTSEATAVAPGMGQPVWSADGKAIIFKRGDNVLMLRDLESGQDKVLHSSPHIHAWALSPDGRQLALTVPSEDQAEDHPDGSTSNSNILVVMPATGGETRELFRVPAAEEIISVVWTPDGRQLLFGRVSGPLYEPAGLWRIPTQGGEPQELALDMTAKQLTSLRFHPDGKQIAFTAGERKQDVWVMENFLPEAKIAKASVPSTRQVWAPALDNMGEVSPDGRYISYVNWSKGNLAVHDNKTGQDRDLTDEGTWEDPQQFCDVSIWSPDSKQVAYYWIDRGAGSRLEIIGLDGSKSRVIAGSKTVEGHAPWPRAWSQDGKYILALHSEEDAALDRGHEDHIVLVSVADGSLRVLKKLGKRHTQFMSLSPDGRYVVYELGEQHGSEKRDIYLLATDGSVDIPLVVHPADDGAPFWTPDGKRIVFLSNRSGSEALWMVGVEDGKPKGTPTQVMEASSLFSPKGFTPDGSFYYSIGTPTLDVHVATLDFEAGKIVASPTKRSLRYEGTNHAPFWSPDGKYLAYASKRSAENTYVLVIQSLETGQERDLSPKSLQMFGANIYFSPQWSPDGRSILVAGGTGYILDLCLVDVETGDFTTLVESWCKAKDESSAPRWIVFSNDGKQIYYIRGNRSIVALDLGTRREKELFRANTYIYRLACSPDGQQLAFFEAAQAVRPTVINTIPTTGGEPRVLYTLKEGSRFSWDVGISWTPDGRHVVVGGPDAPDKPDELWSIPATGGEPRKLDLGVKVNHLSLHPDGKRISFTAGEYGEEVWALENFLPEPSSAK